MDSRVSSGGRAVGLIWLAGWCVLALGLSGCPSGGGLSDPLSPQADVRVTKLTAPGGSPLAPVVSAATGATTTAASVEFPQVAVDLTVFNGVSVGFVGYVVEYFQEDGVTPFGAAAFSVALSSFLQAKLEEDGFETTTITVDLAVVSSEARSLLAGPDGRLGTDDDFRGTVHARVSIRGRDINGHDVTATAGVSLTTRPAASP